MSPTEGLGAPIETRPLVSVIVPARNAVEVLAETLDSVHAQTHRPIELLVVDHASSDGTPELITRWAAAHQAPRFTIRPLHNRGPTGAGSASRNVALGHATGDYVQYLDHDDVLHPQKLQLQVQTALSEDADLVVSRNEVFERRAEIAALLTSEPQWRDDLPIPVPYYTQLRWSLLSWLVRRDLVDRVGPFEETIGMGDYDMDVRLKLHAHKVVYVNALLSFWRRAAGSMTRSAGPRLVGWRHATARTICGRLRDHGITDPAEYAYLSRYAASTTRRCVRVGRPVLALRSLALSLRLVLTSLVCRCRGPHRAQPRRTP